MSTRILAYDCDGIAIAGHIGTWHVIETEITPTHGMLFLLEHDEYGDETAGLIVDKFGNIVMEDVWNGFDDYLDEYGE